MEQKENWLTQIRKMAPILRDAENSVFVSEAKLKKRLAELKIQATAEGCRTVSAQEIFAENDEEIFILRLDLAKKRGLLLGHKTELKALEIGFEEWRTNMVNFREEKKRYGA